MKGMKELIDLSIENYKKIGIRGIIDGLCGFQIIEVLRESVVDVKKTKTGYIVTTTDTRQNHKYLVKTSPTDEGDPEYDEAVRLSGTNSQLRQALLPDGRVKGSFTVLDEDGEAHKCFNIYVHYDNQQSVEKALNRYFKDEFFAASRRCRKDCLNLRKSLA